jgi:hypothetical protein
VLKLVFHTAAFGPIDLEYHRQVIRVGRSEDNDLVLRHPSVEPHHCLLVFRGETVLWLPPSQTVPSATDLERLTGREFVLGDSLTIGELQFSLAHSATTVGIPEPHREDSAACSAEAEGSIGASEPRYYCPRCRAFVARPKARRVGLMGHAKHNLCPKCSCLLKTEPEP